MEHIKNIVLPCIFCMFLVMGKEAFAFNNCLINEKPNVEQCSAPAPDSLRVVTIGGDFVELGWLPAWEGARQNVEVFIRTNETDWMPQYVLDSVVGASIVLAGLDLTQEYGVKISTYCPSGELSTQSKFIDGINLIIDLAVAGRNPVKPTIVDCHNIDLSNKWIGFRISYNYQGIQLSNTFEFVPITKDDFGSGFINHAVIKRVQTTHPIVAARSQSPYPYPTPIEPIIELAGNPFRIDRLIGDGIERLNVGYVSLKIMTNTIDLCPDPDFPWMQDHSFLAMISNQNNDLRADSINFDRERKDFFTNKFSYQNPINEVAAFDFSNLLNGKFEAIEMSVCNSIGKVLIYRKGFVSDGRFETNVGQLLPGLYIFHFTIKDFNYAIPVIKQ